MNQDNATKQNQTEAPSNAPLLAARHLCKSFSGSPRRWPAGLWSAADDAAEREQAAAGAPDPANPLRPATPLNIDEYEAVARPVNGAARLAVNDVSLEVAAGETLAIVGESGSGKTTLARLLLRLIEPDKSASENPAEIQFDGHDLLSARGSALRALRRQMQMIFQDPFSSLDPRMRVREIVGEPLEIHEPRTARADRHALIAQALAAVGLDAWVMRRFPHEFSGGQRQRVGIARALVLHPRLLVADEPVSALDVSVGAQILELLQTLQKQFGLTYVLISHSLPVVAQLATNVAVMRAGCIVETGPAEQVLYSPRHPYTRALLAAVPTLPD
jgi:ABC-type microcin C transport system duplicated ATPase subunit YejF